MKTLAVRNGDLVLTGSKFGVVEGMARVQQQIGLCLKEPYGNDRFHREWGSVLDEWVGHAITTDIPLEVQAEVVRVVRDTILRQNEQIKARAAAGFTSVIKAEEMIVEISSVNVEQRQDNLLVKITLRTASNQEFTITTQPGSTV